MRKVILGLAVLAAALPFGFAQAQHCDSQIILFSRANVHSEETGNVGNPTVHSGHVGCTVAEPGFDDTDIIYPGSTALKVRWTSGAAPVSATLDFNGTTHALDLKTDPAAPINSDTYDSVWIAIPADASINGGNATVTVCVGDGTVCQSRVYRTIA